MPLCTEWIAWLTASFQESRDVHIVLPLHTEGGAERQPFGLTQGSHVRQVSHIPEHNVLLLDSLVVFIVPKLAPCSESPRDIFAHIGTPNGHIKICELVPLSIIP